MSPTARDLLALKNSAVVYTCAPTTTVAEACRLLAERRVGALLVVEGRLVRGLITDREVARRVVAVGLDPSRTRVEEVMDREVPSVQLEAPLAEVELLLRRRRLRHLPVVGARGLLGMISLGDVARYYGLRERAVDEATAAIP